MACHPEARIMKMAWELGLGHNSSAHALGRDPASPSTSSGSGIRVLAWELGLEPR